MDLFKLALDHRISLTELHLLQVRLGHKPPSASDIADPIADEVAVKLLDLLRLPEFGVVGFGPSNFKAFGPAMPPQPLAPITFIFGPNSSGKSSLLHSLLWGQHAATTGELDVIRPELSGNNVNLGGFQTFRHKRSADSVSLGFTVCLPKRYTLDSTEATARLSLDYSLESKGVSNARPVLRTFTLEVSDHEMLRASRRPNGKMQVDRASVVNASRLSAFMAESDQDFFSFANVVSELVDQLSFDGDGLLPSSSNRGQITQVGHEKKVINLASDFLQHIEALVLDACAIVRDWFDQIAYLGPIRTYPDRTWSFSDYRDADWKAGGGDAWEAIRDIANVRDYVNRFLVSTGYIFRVKNYIAETEAKEAVENYLTIKPVVDGYSEEQKEAIAKGREEEEGFDFDRFSLNRTFRHRDLVLVDIRNRIEVSARDVGVGISQLVPVVAMAYGLERKTILMEQPEIHVHPKLQADLGDVFIESSLREALMGNRYIIETHSETLILRVLRRIRETKLGKVNPCYAATAEDVAIYYVEPTKEGSILRRIRIDDTGRMIDRVPGGFFEDNFAEMFA